MHCRTQLVARISQFHWLGSLGTKSQQNRWNVKGFTPKKWQESSQHSSSWIDGWQEKPRTFWDQCISSVCSLFVGEMTWLELVVSWIWVYIVFVEFVCIYIWSPQDVTYIQFVQYINRPPSNYKNNNSLLKDPCMINSGKTWEEQLVSVSHGFAFVGLWGRDEKCSPDLFRKIK